jgi:hypothetical protein
MPGIFIRMTPLMVKAEIRVMLLKAMKPQRLTANQEPRVVWSGGSLSPQREPAPSTVIRDSQTQN